MAGEGHCRRKFYDVWEATQSPVAKQALDRIAAVYAIGDKARFAPAAERVEHRRKTAPLLDKFFDWAKATVGKLSGKLELAKAFRYTIDRREALTRFVTDGRLEADNNVAENAMRGIALGRNYPHVRIMCSRPRWYRKRPSVRHTERLKRRGSFCA
jgi:transposase